MPYMLALHPPTIPKENCGEKWFEEHPAKNKRNQIRKSNLAHFTVISIIIAPHFNLSTATLFLRLNTATQHGGQWQPSRHS